jgi:hypothetical protein
MLDSVSRTIRNIIKSVRNSSPRYNFVSDEQIIEISSTSYSPSEFLARITQLFPGIQKIVFEHVTNPETNLPFENKILVT